MRLRDLQTVFGNKPFNGNRLQRENYVAERIMLEVLALDTVENDSAVSAFRVPC
jgi:hypothetical protein